MVRLIAGLRMSTFKRLRDDVMNKVIHSSLSPLVRLWSAKARRFRCKFTLRCWICGDGVTLDNCVVDENGAGVHQSCYLAKIALQRATTCGTSPIAGCGGGK